MFNKINTKHKIYSSFRLFAKDLNYNLILTIIWVSLVIEVVLACVGLVLINSGREIIYIGNMGFVENQLLTYLMYTLGLLILHYFYDKYSGVVGGILIFAILAQKILLFFVNPNTMEILYFWVFIVLVITWYYLDIYVSNLAIWGSFLLFIIGVDLYDISLNGLIPMMIFMMIFTVGTLAMSIYLYLKAKKDFHISMDLVKDKELELRNLHYDEQSGFMTKFAIEQYVENNLNLQQKEIYLLVMDLDDLTVCNELYGHIVGDTYIKTFCNIIRFIINTPEDVIGRFGGDEYIAILPSYFNEQEVRNKLKRYNQLIKVEFDARFHDSRFVPNFSYGLSKITAETNYRDAYILGDQLRRHYKNKNKRSVSEDNFYKPYINYASLFNAGNIVAVVWLDISMWPLAFATSNIKDLLGYTSEYFLENGHYYFELLHPNDKEATFNDLRDSLERHLPSFEQKYRLEKKTGDYIWVRSYNVPVYENEKILQINGYIYDITSEVETEELLIANDQRLNDIIEATNVGTWEWDLVTDIISYSDNFAGMIGETLDSLGILTLDEWIGRIHKEDKSVFYKSIQEYINGGSEIFEQEYRMLHASGKWVWIYNKGRTISFTNEGVPTMMVGSQTDMTEIKRTEAMLQHSEKLSALGRLSGGIAHDMNNQLMIISGLIDLALELDSEDTYRKHMHTISQVSEKASDVVRQLLAFTKHHLFEQKPINIVYLLKNMTDMLDHTFKKDIHIELELLNEGLYISGDSSLLENAFINLCINARDAMDHGGLLKIVGSVITLPYDLSTYSGHIPRGDYVKITFEDTGCGIKEHEISKVFEPLYTTKDTGNGIGLSTVLSVISQHDGGVTVKSIDAVGTTFEVLLPLIEKVDDVNTIGLLQGKESKDLSLQVLVVDDESIICQVISEFLELNGCSTIPFTHPEDALIAYKKLYHHIDIVVLDMLMPAMNGDELFEKMIKVNPNVKVLFVSGYSEGLEVSKDNKKNIIGFIEKPVKMDDLYNAIVRGAMSL